MASPSFEQALSLRPECIPTVVWKFVLTNWAGSFSLHLLLNGTVRFSGIEVGGLWCQGTGPLSDHLILHYHYQGDLSPQKYSIFKQVPNTRTWIRVDSWAAVMDVLSEVL